MLRRRFAVPQLGVLLAVSALAVPGWSQPASARVAGYAQSPQWQVRVFAIPPLTSPKPLVAPPAADSPDDAWATGLAYIRPLLDRWNGARWKPVTLPRKVARLLGPMWSTGPISASSPRNVWTFGQTSDEAAHASSREVWLHYNGRHWAGGRIRLRGSTYVSAVVAAGQSGVWAFGNPAAWQLYAWHGDRGGWTRTRLPGPGMSITSAVAGRSADIWAAEASQLGTGLALLHLVHGTWNRIRLPRRMQHGYLASVVPCGPDCALVGSAVANHHHGTTPAVGRWNGHHWTVTTLPLPPTADYDLGSLVKDGRQLLATVVNLHSYTPGFWQDYAGRWTPLNLTASPPVAPLQLAVIPGTTSIWATARSDGRIRFALLSRKH
jgi:hypothetical protein